MTRITAQNIDMFRKMKNECVQSILFQTTVLLKCNLIPPPTQATHDFYFFCYITEQNYDELFEYLLQKKKNTFDFDN